MSVLAKYTCLDCGEVFDNRIQAVIHHMQTKHQNFEMTGTDVKVMIKS